jgi:S1-C subfamily serine protease
LQPYTLILDRLPRHSWSGFAVYLGDGKILTAEHVIGEPPNPPPYAEIAGRTLPTAVVRRGRFADVDLAELSVDINSLPASIRALPPLPICPADPVVGIPVLVIIPNQIAISHIVSSEVLPPWLFSPSLIAQFPTLIGDVNTTGNSGSGVFDPALGCLLGIMSRKITLTHTDFVDGVPVKHVQPLAKYFVGPMVIRHFLGD